MHGLAAPIVVANQLLVNNGLHLNAKRENLLARINHWM